LRGWRDRAYFAVGAKPVDWGGRQSGRILIYAACDLGWRGGRDEGRVEGT
jgi:hypothetical protein